MQTIRLELINNTKPDPILYYINSEAKSECVSKSGLYQPDRTLVMKPDGQMIYHLGMCGIINQENITYESGFDIYGRHTFVVRANTTDHEYLHILKFQTQMKIIDKNLHAGLLSVTLVRT